MAHIRKCTYSWFPQPRTRVHWAQMDGRWVLSTCAELERRRASGSYWLASCPEVTEWAA